MAGVPRPVSFANAKPAWAKSGQFKCGWDSGATVPTDGTAGWDPNALFIHIDATNQFSEGLYVNFGTAASCNFDALELTTATGAYRSRTSGTAAPTGAGYNKGAEHIDTDAAIGLRHLANYGDTTTANYDVAQHVRNPGNDVTGAMFGAGITTPTDGTAGWGVNAIFMNTAGAASNTRMFINKNTAAACTFAAITLTIA